MAWSLRSPKPSSLLHAQPPGQHSSSAETQVLQDLASASGAVLCAVCLDDDLLIPFVVAVVAVVVAAASAAAVVLREVVLVVMSGEKQKGGAVISAAPSQDPFRRKARK